ncbi:hypothetical protein [Rhodanobacter sp. Root480]|uniref:hypothetical protein n=1 Tax=Rhodanobacter sp. Root480 TaxID=1736542 RepID=UPI000AD6F2B4|nr:hypothetical protein [Rhodanobacter sp. Root480]
MSGKKDARTLYRFAAIFAALKVTVPAPLRFHFQQPAEHFPVAGMCRRKLLIEKH